MEVQGGESVAGSAIGMTAPNLPDTGSADASTHPTDPGHNGRASTGVSCQNVQAAEADRRQSDQDTARIRPAADHFSAEDDAKG